MYSKGCVVGGILQSGSLELALVAGFWIIANEKTSHGIASVLTVVCGLETNGDVLRNHAAKAETSD